MNDNIPGMSELVDVPEDMDAKYVIRHFYGKTIEEASELFFLHPYYYEEDLLWMGVKAYFYYIHSIKKHLQSDEGKYDDVFISNVLGTIEHRLKNEPDFKRAFNYQKKGILDILSIIKKNIDDSLMAENGLGDGGFLDCPYNDVPERLSHLINLCKTDE